MASTSEAIPIAVAAYRLHIATSGDENGAERDDASRGDRLYDKPAGR